MLQPHPVLLEERAHRREEALNSGAGFIPCYKRKYSLRRKLRQLVLKGIKSEPVVLRDCESRFTAAGEVALGNSYSP